jgi:hypothetical protein
MRNCPKCGRGVEESWSTCMSCGTSLQPAAPSAPAGPVGTAAAAAPAAGAPAAAAPGAPSVPAAGGVSPFDSPLPSSGRVDLEIPRYQGGTAPAGKSGMKPVLLIVLLLVVIAIAGIVYFVWGGGSSSSSARAPATAATDGGAAAPAQGNAPQGVVDRAKAGLQQMGTELKQELQDEWKALDTEPAPAQPAQPAQPTQPATP